MGFSVSIVLFFIAFMSYQKEKNIIAPVTMFCTEWGVITFLASLRLFSLYEVSLKTWVIILIGSVSFVLGCKFGNKIKSKQCLKYTKKSFEFDRKKYTKFFYIMLVLLILIKLLSLKESLNLLKKGVSLSLIRSASYGEIVLEGYTLATGLQYYITSIIGPVIELFFVALGIILFLTDIKKQKKIIVFILLYEIIQSLASGGRFSFAYLAIELLVCYGMMKKKRIMAFSISKKIKRTISLSLILIFGIIIFVSLARSQKLNEFAEQIYIYMCGDIFLLNQKLNTITSTSVWALGFAGGYGFWSLFFTGLIILGIPLPALWNEVSTSVMNGQIPMYIGDGITMNAFVTPYYYLYADFRIIGVVIGMILFGVMSGFLYKKAKYSNNIGELIAYLIVTQMIFKTLHTYPLVSQVYVIAIICFAIRNIRIKFRSRGGKA